MPYTQSQSAVHRTASRQQPMQQPAEEPADEPSDDEEAEAMDEEVLAMCVYCGGADEHVEECGGCSNVVHRLCAEYAHPKHHRDAFNDGDMCVYCEDCVGA